MAEGELGRRPEDGLLSGEEGGEHGHELKIRRPGGVRARALARRRAAALP